MKINIKVQLFNIDHIEQLNNLYIFAICVDIY